MADQRYPNCRCERLFGLGNVCGDPECDQIKEINEGMKRLGEYFRDRVKDGGGMGDTTFNLPDLRGPR